MYFLITSKSKDQHRILFFENSTSCIAKSWIKDDCDKSYIMFCKDVAYERGYSLDTSLTIDNIRSMNSWDMKEISEEEAFSLLL